MGESVYERATSYLRAGLSLLPVTRDGLKRPALEKWDWLQDELPTADHLSEWFERDRPAGIGVISGGVSGNLDLLDFDADAESVFLAWRDLVEAEQPGLFDRLNVVRTPRPGYHVRCRVDGVVAGSTTLARRPHPDFAADGRKDVTLIETRGEGGYGLAPGSPPECHETGRLYEHVSGPPLTELSVLTVDEHELLYRCARLFHHERPRMRAKASPKPGDGPRPGDAYDISGPSLASLLEPHGWVVVREYDGWQLLRRPGKERGWSATTGYCKGNRGEPLFKCFTSNGSPFKVGECYGRFRTYAELNHDGDLSAAAKELLRQGYGGAGNGANNGAAPAALLASLATRAEESVDAAIEAALADGALVELAKAKVERPGDLESLYRTLERSGAKARAVERLQKVVNQAAKNAKRERGEEAKRKAGAGVASENGNVPGLANYREEEVIRVGLPAETIAARLLALSGGWPRRVGPLLFAETAGPSPLWLDSTAKLFGYAQSRLPGGDRNLLRWAAGADMVAQETFHAYLGQTAECYQAVEPFPHEPAISGHYYLHPPTAGGDGKALRGLVDRFCPATDVDWHLIEGFFLSLFWGGPAGSRPAWLFTAEDDADNGGRGVGKSSVAKVAARLVGGSLTVDHDEKMSDVVKRLLSDEGLTSRLVLLDNLKTLKFSWGQLEGLITAAVVSGHRLYQGEGRRPNTITWAMTLNGAALSRDMAQRCVIVQLARPDYSATWEENVAAYVEMRRWEIVGDCLARLRSTAAPLITHGRWGAWEDGVLARIADPANCQKVIQERQGEVDEDTAEADVVRDYFAARLKNLGFVANLARVFFPSSIAAEWVNCATGEKRPVNRACAYLKQLSRSTGIRKSNNTDGERGFVWNGKAAPATAAAVDVRTRL